MDEKISLPSDNLALEKAAKYICNLKDGLCPMIVEKAELSASSISAPGMLAGPVQGKGG